MNPTLNGPASDPAEPNVTGPTEGGATVNTNTVQSDVSARPSLADVTQYPVIAAVCVAAIGVTLAWWAKVDVSALLASVDVQRGEVWRLLTDIFPHGSVLHLAFNIYWIWIFGAAIEARLGHVKTLLLVLLFAVGSSAAQFALSGGGVGLSGVGYGFFGLLWMLSKKDERFRGTIDPRTINLFLGWFVLCVALTAAKVWQVGNVAHGAGALLGVLVGLAIAEPARRMVFAAGAAALVVASLWGATAGRPMVNYSESFGYDAAKLGYDAIKARKNEEALRWFKLAADRLPAEAWVWYDLGLAYDGVGETEKADVAYRTAHTLKPDDAQYGELAGRHALDLLKQQSANP